MPARHDVPRPRHLATMLAVLALLALAGGAVALATSGHAAKRTPTVHVGTAKNAALGKRILVTAKGRTLYTLSAETHGTFICTDAACLSLWKPLALRNGAKATGVAHLGAVKRPDGRRQATYRGRPLYTFTQDHAKGDANGEGFKDVGTWHAAKAPKSKSAGKAKPPPAPPSGGYGY